MVKYHRRPTIKNDSERRRYNFLVTMVTKVQTNRFNIPETIFEVNGIFYARKMYLDTKKEIKNIYIHSLPCSLSKGQQFKSSMIG